MPSFTRLHSEDYDIAVVLIPDSPLAVRAVDSQPKENLAVRYHGENHQILEMLGQTDSSLEDLSAAGDISQVIVLRRSKAFYTFGSAVDCNIRLDFPRISPEQLEMTLHYGQTAIEVRFLDSNTRLNGKQVITGTRKIPTEAYIQIGHANFKVLPTSSLVAGCKIYQGGIGSPNSSVNEVDMLPTPFLPSLASTVDGHNLQQSPSLAELKKGRLVGRGGQGGVYRYRPANTQQQLVVKILELLDDEDDEAERAIREVVISPMLDHLFLIQALDVFQYPDGFAIVLPYFAFGNLGDDLEGRSLFIEETKTVAVQILLGIENLHENGIIHRDLKPSNILIDSIEPWLKIRIADFGMALMSPNALSAVGTPGFCAPEVHRNGRLTHYGMAVDIFSAGVVFLYMFRIELSYKGYHSEDDFNRRVGGDIESAIGLAQSPEKVAALRTAQIMSTFEPKDRPTIARCFGLPWFEQSQREWRPDGGSPEGAASTQETDRPLRPRQTKVEDRDHSYQPSKKLQNLKRRTRRKGPRHDKPSHKKPNYTQISSSLPRLRR